MTNRAKRAAPSPYVPVDVAWTAADARATILDDRVDIEDEAVYQWLKAHPLNAHGPGLSKTVIGVGLLPPAWHNIRRRFSSPIDVQHFMNNLGVGPDTLRSLQTVYHQSSSGFLPADRATLLREVGNAIICGRAWVLEERRIPSRFVTKTSDAAFTVINPKLGTNIDFQFIAKLEGDQWLRGYVPMQHGVVMGRSGMTVASGFDLGQWDRQAMKAMGFSESLLSKITPFANQPMKHMKKDQVVTLVAKLGPVPILDKGEADACDSAAFTRIAGDSMQIWNRRHAKGVPAFAALPSGWQTVWVSRFYQEGGAPSSPMAKSFRSNALAGNWQDAIASLNLYTDYPSRIAQEVGLLQQKIPPDVDSVDTDNDPLTNTTNPLKKGI